MNKYSTEKKKIYIGFDVSEKQLNIFTSLRNLVILAVLNKISVFGKMA